MPLKFLICPPVVKRLLDRHPGHLVLAGGAPLGAASAAASRVARGGDFDLFIVGLDAAAATRLVREAVDSDGSACSNGRGKGGRWTRTGNAYTLVLPPGPGDAAPVVVQIVRRLYPTAAHVLFGFDLAPGRVGAWIEDGRLVVRAAPSWVVAMRRMAAPVDLVAWSAAGHVRAIKYVAKGFDVYVPGLRRAALLADGGSGLAALVAAEHRILAARDADEHRRAASSSSRWWGKPFASAAAAEPPPPQGPTDRVTAQEAHREARRARRDARCGALESDYGALAKLQGTIAYAVKQVLNMGRMWAAGLASPAAAVAAGGVDVDAEADPWPRAEHHGSVFHPRCPLRGAFDVQKLEKLFADAP